MMLQAVKQHLTSATGHLEPFRCVTLRLSTDDETKVAPTLQRLSAKFEGSVGIGSYPVRPHATLYITMLSNTGWMCARYANRKFTVHYGL